VRLPALEFLERAEEGIGVVEADHEAELDLVVVEVIEERAAVGARVERPSGGVQVSPGTARSGVTSHSSFSPMP
jgi:hypothetical protein